MRYCHHVGMQPSSSLGTLNINTVAFSSFRLCSGACINFNLNTGAFKADDYITYCFGILEPSYYVLSDECIANMYETLSNKT